MLRRNLLLSSLAFCLPSVMAQAKGKRAVVAYFSWYDNTFQERIRPSDIDETTSASLKAPGQVTLVAPGRTHQKLSNEPRYRSPFIGDLTRGTF